MTPEDRARLDALAAQCERMGIDDLRTVPVEDPWALASAIREALSRLAAMEQERDEERALRERLAQILDGVAEALNGPPKPLHLHDWSGLPEKTRLAALRADEAVRVLEEIVRCYDAYRGKGVLPALEAYQAMVHAIECGRAALRAEGEGGGQ